MMKQVAMGVISMSLSGCAAVEAQLNQMGWVRVGSAEVEGTQIVHHKGVVSDEVRSTPLHVPFQRTLTYTQIENEVLPQAPFRDAGSTINEYFRGLERRFDGYGQRDVPFESQSDRIRSRENVYKFAVRHAGDLVDPMHFALALFKNNRQVEAKRLRWVELAPGLRLKLPRVQDLQNTEAEFEALVNLTGSPAADNSYDVVGIDWLRQNGMGGYVTQYAATSRIDRLVQLVRERKSEQAVVYTFRLTKKDTPYYGIAEGPVSATPQAAERGVGALDQPGIWIRSVDVLLDASERLGDAGEDISHLVAQRLAGESRSVNSGSLNTRALLAMADGRYQFGENLRRADSGSVTQPLSSEAFSPRREVAFKELVKTPVSFTGTRSDWQAGTSWGQTSTGGANGEKYYVGVAASRSAYTQTLKSEVSSHDPIQTMLEWNFRPGTTVGSALTKVAEFIGYQVLVSASEVADVYARALPVPHRQLSGLTVGQAIILLGGRGFITVYDHRSRTVGHIPKRAYTAAARLSEGERLTTCPDDLSDASVLNGQGGNVFLLGDGSQCAY